MRIRPLYPVVNGLWEPTVYVCLHVLKRKAKRIVRTICDDSVGECGDYVCDECHERVRTQGVEVRALPMSKAWKLVGLEARSEL